MSSPEKREGRVQRLLQSTGPAWGGTEARSAYVYPRSLCPLRRIAGISLGGEAGDESYEGREQPTGYDVIQLLDEIFPREDALANSITVDIGENIAAGQDQVAKSKEEATKGSKSKIEKYALTDVSFASDAENDDGEGAPRVASDERPRHPKRDLRASASGSRNGPPGRPVFHTYGSGNTSPAVGGVVYGSYMLSRSITPQVFPNRPRTRQVYASTQRSAERAAARVRAGESRRRKVGTMNTLQNDTTGGSTNSSSRGGRVASKVPTTKCVTVPDGRGDHMETRSIAEGEDGISKVVRVTREEKQSEEKCGTSKTLNNRLLLFSSLPDSDEDRYYVESRHPARARQSRHSSKAPPSSARTRPRESREPVAGKTNPSPAGATGSPEHLYPTEEHERQLVDDALSTSLDSRSDAMAQNGSHSMAYPSSAAIHAWTADRRLMNDPRNYKFLPRGWVGELITPAGLPGPEPSGVEAVFPLREQGLRKGRGGPRNPRNCIESGVGACLMWDPPDGPRSR